MTRFTRRRFLETASAAGLLWSWRGHAAPATTFPVQYRKASPWDALAPYIDPGHDEFTIEKEAAEITEQLNRLVEVRSLPLAPGFSGLSPMPTQYRQVADGVFEAEFGGTDREFGAGLKQWLDSLGEIRSARFYVLAHGRVRYEIASRTVEGLSYRVGLWEQRWRDGKLESFKPIAETRVTSATRLFDDVTAEVFQGVESFDQQLLRGTPYWRARLDSACGIDVYGNNGIAVADIDGDGRDEIYVCQPAGLPNRLYKLRDDGSAEDITEPTGLGVLDDSTAALFVDFRNSGKQDLVLLTIGSPLLFVNEGGTFRYKPDAFRFANEPQGTFTGMAAADYDRDGRVDLYLCTYIYYQSEDQYRYPSPYHDAQNGPPNFLFRNRLTADGGGYFEDVTAAVGLSENNNRYSFAPAWCDFDGDGWPDLYVANDFGRNSLYKNDRGQFRDVAAAAGVEDLGPGMSSAWLDYDGDGRPDLYVSNMWTAAGLRVVEQMVAGGFKKQLPGAEPKELAQAYWRHAKGNSLYKNRGDGTFAEVDEAEGVAMGRWAWSADAFDFDNDGSPEIYVTCGMLTNSSEKDLGSFFWRQVVSRSPAAKRAAPEYENGWNALDQWIREDYSWNGREPNVLYARRGTRFYDFSGVSSIDFADDSRTFAATDFDGDGNVDVLLKSRLGPQVRVLRNQWGAGGSAIALVLRGVKSNRDAIGAQVEVQHAGGKAWRQVTAGSGYLAQHTKVLHVGLGAARAAEKVRVRWPSGEVQEFAELAAGFRYTIAEGSSEVQRKPFAARKDSRPPAGILKADNQPRFQPTWLLEPVPIPDKRTGPGFVCVTAGEAVARPQGVPFELVKVERENPDVAAGYALFRRYLFDHRTGLTLPLLVLIDERGLAHKVYPSVPDTDVLRRDLELMRQPDRARLGLPFPGRYYAPPRRNYFRLGAAFFWAGYPEQALLYLNEVVRRNPENGKTHLAIGNINLHFGRFDVAREHLDRAKVLLPDSAETWSNAGSLELASKNFDGAVLAFEKALAIYPDSFSLVGAGRAYAGKGDLRTAEQMFQRAIEKDPRDAEAANQMGLLLARQKRNVEAKRHFEQAIAVQRDHASAINNLGVLFMQMNKPDDALAAFRYGIEVAPEDETLYLNLARFYVQTGDRSKARDVLEQLLSRKPDSGVAKRALGELGGQ